MKSIRVSVPASTANLGPAFDCLALALDLWNETAFTVSGDRLEVSVQGEGGDHLARDADNLIVRAFRKAFEEAGEAFPAGVRIECHNRIPLGSGLGSSAAAVLSGLLAANAVLGDRFSKRDILRLGAEMEGHADNLAAAMHGGLVLVVDEGDNLIAQEVEIAPLNAVVLLPDTMISTEAARNALPERVAMRDAVFNIGHSLQVIEALRVGDIRALVHAMKDRLHQDHRLPLMPGAAEALEAGRRAGAATALSGAGPGLIAIIERGQEEQVSEAMRAPFSARGIQTRRYLLKSVRRNAEIIRETD